MKAKTIYSAKSRKNVLYFWLFTGLFGGHRFFVGKKMRSAFKENSNSVWSESTVDLIKKLEKLNFNDSDILIKGSRSLELEKVIDTIKQISV